MTAYAGEGCLLWNAAWLNWIKLCLGTCYNKLLNIHLYARHTTRVFRVTCFCTVSFNWIKSNFASVSYWTYSTIHVDHTTGEQHSGKLLFGMSYCTSLNFTFSCTDATMSYWKYDSWTQHNRRSVQGCFFITCLYNGVWFIDCTIYMHCV